MSEQVIETLNTESNDSLKPENTELSKIESTESSAVKKTETPNVDGAKSSKEENAEASKDENAATSKKENAETLKVEMGGSAEISQIKSTITSKDEHAETSPFKSTVTSKISAIETPKIENSEASKNETIEKSKTEISDSEIEKFLKDLKEEKLKYSKEVACETVKLLERIITNSQWETARELMDLIKNVGKTFEQSVSQATHTVVFNMVKRVLKIIRDEYSSALGKVDEYELQESLQKILVAEEQLDFTEQLDSLKKSISANLRELMEEFERSSQDIAAQSQEHIHFGEVILTFGYSKTVEKFLKKAVKLKCEVLVAEAFPSLGGHDLAKSLAESGIQTTLIQDAAIFALMSRVDKVIIGTHSVMANGGLKALCGTHPLALAAKYHSKPFIVLAPMFKLTPQYVTSSDQDGFNHMRSPEELIPYDDSDLFDGVEIINPAFDYVPPELISLMISNMGGNAPTYVYRLLSEMYHPDDYSF